MYEKHKEADLKTRISATKEILKRYPGDDKLVKAQIRKAEAEADIAESKAKLLRGGKDNRQVKTDEYLEGLKAILKDE